MGKPAATDRPRLTPLSHSFTLDWVVTCKSAAEARSAVDAARRILKQLGVELHPQKTRIVHVRYGFEFLGYKIKRGKKLHLPESKIRSQARSGALYAYPREKSIQRFQDQVRQRTKRRVPLKTQELIAKLNPLLRRWGEYYKRAHVRTLFNQLDRWIVRRIWSHRFKRWRNGGWKQHQHLMCCRDDVTQQDAEMAYLEQRCLSVVAVSWCLVDKEFVLPRPTKCSLPGKRTDPQLNFRIADNSVGTHWAA
jgi:hypothetical protein